MVSKRIHSKVLNVPVQCLNRSCIILILPHFPPAWVLATFCLRLDSSWYIRGFRDLSKLSVWGFLPDLRSKELGKWLGSKLEEGQVCLSCQTVTETAGTKWRIQKHQYSFGWPAPFRQRQHNYFLWLVQARIRIYHFNIIQNVRKLQHVPLKHKTVSSRSENVNLAWPTSTKSQSNSKHIAGCTLLARTPYQNGAKASWCSKLQPRSHMFFEVSETNAAVIVMFGDKNIEQPGHTRFEPDQGGILEGGSPTNKRACLASTNGTSILIVSNLASAKRGIIINSKIPNRIAWFKIRSFKTNFLIVYSMNLHPPTPHPLTPAPNKKIKNKHLFFEKLKFAIK